MVSQSLPRKAKLVDKSTFDAVFSASDFRLHGRSCLVLARLNKAGRARLGIIAAKKNIALAVQRNRFRRVTREAFRRSKLQGLDIIVLAKKSKTKKINSVLLSSELYDLFSRLEDDKRP